MCNPDIGKDGVLIQLFTEGEGDRIYFPAVGLVYLVRMPLSSSDDGTTVIESIKAQRFDPPRHQLNEAEIFRALDVR